MKIQRIQIGKIRVPLITPFKTALRTVEYVEDVVIKIETDTGLSGWGEAPPTAAITGETLESITGAIQFIACRLIGKNLSNFRDILETVQTAIVKNTSAKAALEIALYDLWSQNFEKPLYQVLGGGPSKLYTDLTISVDCVDKMVSDSEKAVSQGFRTLKIKVGKNIEEDIERIRAIYQAVGKGIKLCIDVNQGWTVKQTIYGIDRLKELGIFPDFLEQPVIAANRKGLKHVTEYSPYPVLADEAVFSPEDAAAVLADGAADIINIKLMKTGGLSNAMRILAIAEIYRTECMIGCMLEAGISVTAAAHLASAYHKTITRIDLDGPALCSENPLQGGIVMDGPVITLPDTPGLGITAVEGWNIEQEVC